MLAVKTSREVIELLFRSEENVIDFDEKRPIIVLMGNAKNMSRFECQLRSLPNYDNIMIYHLYDNDLCNVLLVYDKTGVLPASEKHYFCSFLLEREPGKKRQKKKLNIVELPTAMINCPVISFYVNTYRFTSLDSA